ncbi:hypothetical protein ACWGE1_19245 [Streptomyces sp. NPDC054932]
MRKLMAATAAAGSLLMVGATAGTAAAADPVEPWNKKIDGAYGSGMIAYADGPQQGVVATGKLTVTDTNPKACYTISVGVFYLRHMAWAKSSQKQCGPGTLDITASLTGLPVWDPEVAICKVGVASRGCKL